MFRATLYETVPVPAPCVLPGAIVTHDALLAAVHGQPSPAPLSDQFLQQGRREDAFGVIGQHQGMEPGQAGG